MKKQSSSNISGSKVIMTPVQLDVQAQESPQNPCLVVTPTHKIFSATAPISSCQPHEVKIHIKSTGICGTDIHYWKHGRVGDLALEKNLILGHETAGQIVQVGSAVRKSLKVGDRVAIEPQVPCGECYLCMDGHYNLCQSVSFLGVPPTNGSMQRYLCTDARFVHIIPDNMSYEEGALVEVFSVAWHGIRKAGGITPGKPCMVAGCGPIGLATLMIADVAGAYPIVATDISEERLGFAKTLIPSLRTYCSDTSLSIHENAMKIRSLFGNSEYVMPPVVLECTGVASSINTSCYVVRRNGIVTILGVSCKNELDGFPFMPLSFGEVDIRFINRYADSWPAVINLISSGKLDASKLISHRFNLEEATKAFECVVDPTRPSIKVMIVDN